MRLVTCWIPKRVWTSSLSNPERHFCSMGAWQAVVLFRLLSLFLLSSSSISSSPKEKNLTDQQPAKCSWGDLSHKAWSQPEVVNFFDRTWCFRCSDNFVVMNSIMLRWDPSTWILNGFWLAEAGPAYFAVQTPGTIEHHHICCRHGGKCFELTI